MNKILCTDKEPLPKRATRGSAGFCFQRGKRIGYIAGLKKGIERAIRKAKEVKGVRERTQQQPQPQQQIPRANSLKGGEARGLLERYLARNPRLARKYMVLDGNSKYRGTEQPISNLPLSDLRRILIQYGQAV